MHILTQINEYWALIGGVFALVVSFVRMESAIRSLNAKDEEQQGAISEIQRLHRQEIEDIRKEMKSNNLEFKKIEVAIKGIETSLEFIKDKLKYLDEK